MSINARVNPVMLRWARDASGFTLETIARKARVSKETILKAEAGRGFLSIRQLRDVARAYKRPVAVFYLQKPPRDFTFPDFRMVPGSEHPVPSPNLRIAIREMSEKRRNAVDISNVSDPPPGYGFVGMFDARADPEMAAKQVRDLLKHDPRELKECTDACKAFTYWRGLIERVGVLVFQFSGIEPRECRGFVHAEPPFPVIAINQGDAINARVFTLIHEFCHVILGTTGICDPFSRDDADLSAQERFCQRVAAATLMGREEVMADIRREPSPVSIKTVTKVSGSYKVSAEAFLIRLHELGMIDAAFLARGKDK